jgi:DNA-binding SARP family transcriptional activator
VHIGFLGPLSVDGGASMRPRTRTVLAALGVERGEVVSPERLAQAVWGDDPPTSWPKQVQICVWDLRRVLGADAVQTAAGGYRLVGGEELDVEYFEALLARARDLAAIGEPDRAVSTFRAALDLWRGRPFEDLDGWAPGRIEVARLEEVRRRPARP